MVKIEWIRERKRYILWIASVTLYENGYIRKY